MYPASVEGKRQNMNAQLQDLLPVKAIEEKTGIQPYCAGGYALPRGKRYTDASSVAAEDRLISLLLQAIRIAAACVDFDLQWLTPAWGVTILQSRVIARLMESVNLLTDDDGSPVRYMPAAVSRRTPR